MINIEKVTHACAHLQTCVKLFRAYAAELDVDLHFQHFSEELSDPLKKYGPPGGALLLALFNNEAAGCVALQPLADKVCEMKRLYVSPAFRKVGLGKQLIDSIINEAIKAGYESLVLDTLDKLQPAIALYKQAGFYITAAYYPNPLPGVVYMKKDLV